MTGNQRLDVFCLWYLNKMVIKLAVLLGFKVKNAKKHVKYVHTVLAKKYFFFSLFNFWDRVGASFKSQLRLHSKNAGSDRLRTRLTTMYSYTVCDWWRYCFALLFLKYRALQWRHQLNILPVIYTDRDVLHPVDPEVHLCDQAPHELGQHISVPSRLQLQHSLYSIILVIVWWYFLSSCSSTACVYSNRSHCVVVFLAPAPAHPA